MLKNLGLAIGRAKFNVFGASFEQRRDRSHQLRTALDQLFSSHGSARLARSVLTE